MRIEEIIERFGGLIDEETAELLVRYMDGSLKASGSVSGRVEKVFPKRKFGEHVVLPILLDSRVKVNLWDSAAELDVVEGATLKASGRLREGQLDVFDARCVSVEVRFTEIAKIVPDERVNVRGRISGLGDAEKGREVYISDASGRVRVVLWNCREIYNEVDIGDCVEVLNGIVRLNKWGEMEVHVDRKSRVRFCE